MIDTLSKDLTLAFGKGFSRTNQIYMRLFYKEFQISQKASDLLRCCRIAENYGQAKTKILLTTNHKRKVDNS